MKVHFPETGWMSHMNIAHAMHMPHPGHWLHEHSMTRRILIAAAITLLLFGLVRLAISMPQGTELPAMYPYGPIY